MENLSSFVNAIGELIKVLPKALIISVFSLLSIMTYWYCSIFLIANHFYLVNDKVILLAFTFILSVNWYIVNIGLSALQIVVLERLESLKYNENGNENEPELDIDGVFATGAIASVLYLSFILFVFHYNHWNFFNFLLTCYGYILLGLLRIGIGYWIYNKAKN